MSDDIIPLTNNPIAPADQQKLESYGAHVIQNGWATRFSWTVEDGDPRFNLFQGGADERLAACVGRHRAHHEFFAENEIHQEIASGTLAHVMAELDIYLKSTR